VTTSSVRPVVLRNDVGIEDPLSVVLAFLQAYRRLGIGDPAEPVAFGEPDLRLANRGGARISAAEIAAILERRGAIEGALRAIAPDVSLAGAADSVPWLVLRQLFDAFADIRGVGFAKMTKALYPKRPALIPMLDSIVQKYLRDDDLGAHAPFGERALGLVHGYKRDLDRNWAAIRAVREELAGSGYRLTEVRILDLLILSASAETATRPAGGLPGGGLLPHRGGHVQRRDRGQLVPVRGHSGDSRRPNPGQARPARPRPSRRVCRPEPGSPSGFLPGRPVGAVSVHRLANGVPVLGRIPRPTRASRRMQAPWSVRINDLLGEKWSDDHRFRTDRNRRDDGAGYVLGQTRAWGASDGQIIDRYGLHWLIGFEGAGT
jgi:Family of unknown function (DUF6308)